MAEFVVNSHTRSHPYYNEDDTAHDGNISRVVDDGGPEPLTQDQLKKYITYSRANVRPVVRQVDTEKVCSIEWIINVLILNHLVIDCETIQCAT